MQHAPGFLAIVDDAKSRVREVSVAETQARLAARPAAMLVDVREDREWEAGHAAGAGTGGDRPAQLRPRTRRATSGSIHRRSSRPNSR